MLSGKKIERILINKPEFGFKVMYAYVDYIETHLNMTSLTSGSFMDWFCLLPCVYLVFSLMSIKTM